MSRAACTCERYQLTAPDGTVLDGELRRDPDCRQHGFPTDQWPAGHPLRRHMRFVVRKTGQVVTGPAAREIYEEARRDARDRTGWDYLSFDAVIREETPRETEQRLYDEARGRAA